MTKFIASGISTRGDYSTSVHDVAMGLEKLETEMEKGFLLVEEASRLTTQARETRRCGEVRRYKCKSIYGSHVQRFCRATTQHVARLWKGGAGSCTLQVDHQRTSATTKRTRRSRSIGTLVVF